MQQQQHEQSSLDLASFLAGLPPDVKSQVFASSWTAQALFRALTPLEKQYILRLMYVDASVSADTMRLWLRPAAEAQHNKALQQLRQLAVLQSDRQGSMQLNTDFKRCLRAALAGRGLGAADGGQQAYQGPAPVQALVRQAARQWQAVLSYVLDCDADLPLGNTDETGFSIHDLLLSARLVSDDDGRHELTAEGLRYLLQPTSVQVWRLLHAYIRRAEQQARDGGDAGSNGGLAATLSFLMQLSFRRVWQPHPLAALAPQERIICNHMQQLGLVATCSQDEQQFFCATPLAASLCGGVRASAAAAAAGGDRAGGAELDRGASAELGNAAYIIVETNFRVYAHTTSALQRAVLGRLMRTDCVLPNLYVGTLTRETFMAALEQGLTAADVTRFLQQHAHPQAARRAPSVPENVQEQLVLWEGETRRLVAEAVKVYDFAPDDDEATFEYAKNHAVSLGAAAWASDKKRLLAVKAEFHDAMRGFISEYKAMRARQG